MTSRRHPLAFLAIVLGLLSLPLPSATAAGNVYSHQLTAEDIQAKRANYQARLAELEKFRLRQAADFAAADPARQRLIITAAREHLQTTLRHDLFPAWFGTQWAFSGTTTTPGVGKIACGYFVSTCLTQAGFKVNRVKLAQQPSQRIIETFMPKANRKIIAGGKPMALIRDHLKTQGDGIYIVGLDQHVGFISVVGDDMAFVHSSYYQPPIVVAEKIDSKNPLSDSQYRVFGKLFADDMILAWLTDRTYPVATE